MTTTAAPQSPPGKGRLRRLLERIGWVIASGLASYAVLLIPFGDEGPVPPTGQVAAKQPFAWNNDAYWKTLEEAYRSLKRGGCATAGPGLDADFQEARNLLQRIEEMRLDSEAQELRDLESLIFKMGPVVSACDSRVNDYVAFIADMRNAVKVRSVDWDMASPSARTTLYRLLYGSRAAAEVRRRCSFRARTSPPRRRGPEFAQRAFTAATSWSPAAERRPRRSSLGAATTPATSRTSPSSSSIRTRGRPTSSRRTSREASWSRLSRSISVTRSCA
jgi:hypothetical protein